MSPVPYWLNEDGDYWVDAEETPDMLAAAGEIFDVAVPDSDDGSLYLVGRGPEWLRDCPVDHECETGYGCDTHGEQACPCPRERKIDAWHFSTWPSEGARKIEASEVFHGVG